MTNEIICRLEKEGFMAHYYPGNRDTNIAIISVGGASCDEKTSIAMSGFLRRAGYNVLVLGFYLWKGLSKDLCAVPIDYVEHAVKWLKTEQKIEKIAMTGASTGAGFTLNCAARIPEITCVIPVVPYDYVLEGTNSKYQRMNCAVYTYHGESVPYTDCEMLDQGILYWLRMAHKAKGYGLKRFMRWGYDFMEERLNPDSRIPVENMNADVLLLGVKDDDCWPSDVAVPRIVEVLKKNNYSHRVDSFVYERASHALADGIESMSGFARFALTFMIPAEKKYPKECEEARQDSFLRILKFIEEWSGNS